MSDALGLLLLVFYIVTILGISGAVTFAVVKLFPTDRHPKPDKPDTPSTDNGTQAGRLFRRAKRGTA